MTRNSASPFAGHSAGRRRFSPGNFRRAGARRRGLAPLELVLAIPILMLPLCLMIDFGVAACWKVRTSVAARHAAFRARAEWDAEADPPPENFPPPAAVGSGSGADLASVLTLWNQPPLTDGWARGPVMFAADSNAEARIELRNRRYLEMDERVLQGSAEVSRPMPLIPSLGSFHFRDELDIVDSRWQFTTMGLPDGGNESRRAKGWYNLEDLPEWAEAAARFAQADAALVGYPLREYLRPLDRDEEFDAFYGNPPDFYPRIGGCSLSRSDVQRRVDQLVERIQGRTGGGRGGVPDQMASAFIRLYRDQIDLLEQQVPRPAAQIAQLEEKIRQLQAFQNTLR